MPPIPSLSAMRAFETAARLLSFTRASAELGVTQAAVSWQVKALEQRLGVLLFERHRSGLALTTAGRDLLPDISHALARLQGAFDRVGGRSRSSITLRISSTPTFAHAWLAPRLGSFHGRHPGITTQLEASKELADLAGGVADVAIRRGRGVWPGLTGHRLMPLVLAPLCAPGLTGGEARLPASEIVSLPLLQPIAIWRRWLAHVGADPDLAAGRAAARYLNQHMVIQAALAGQGVALLNPAFCADALRERRLVWACPEALVSAEEGYWLVHGSGRQARRVEQFRDWILSEVTAPRPAGMNPPATRKSGEVDWR